MRYDTSNKKVVWFGKTGKGAETDLKSVFLFIPRIAQYVWRRVSLAVKKLDVWLVWLEEIALRGFN